MHAIGGGLALCEIQQLSDVTYRLYDYGRPRELHLDRGVAVADLGPYTGRVPGDTVRCPYFVTESLDIAEESKDSFDRPHLLIVLEGEGSMGGLACRAGEVWLADGDSGFEIHAIKPLRLLRTSIPC